MTISHCILPIIRKFSEKICRDDQNTHFMFNNFFRKSRRLWDNVKKYGTAQQATHDNIIRCMRFVCSITKATDTHSHYLIRTYCFSTTRMVTWTRLNVTLYVHYLSCLSLNTCAHLPLWITSWIPSKLSWSFFLSAVAASTCVHSEQAHEESRLAIVCHPMQYSTRNWKRS